MDLSRRPAAGARTRQCAPDQQRPRLLNGRQTLRPLHSERAALTAGLCRKQLAPALHQLLDRIFASSSSRYVLLCDTLQQPLSMRVSRFAHEGPPEQRRPLPGLGRWARRIDTLTSRAKLWPPIPFHRVSDLQLNAPQKAATGAEIHKTVLLPCLSLPGRIVTPSGPRKRLRNVYRQGLRHKTVGNGKDDDDRYVMINNPSAHRAWHTSLHSFVLEEPQ